MIHVEYEKENNYPHDRELILFDRSGFQHTHRDTLAEINKKYNILCPQVFVMECIAPDNTDKKPEEELEKDKESLREKLELIENPIVLTGDTHKSPVNQYTSWHTLPKYSYVRRNSGELHNIYSYNNGTCGTGKSHLIL